MKTILVPIDFSPASRTAVAEAMRLARQQRARVVLTHVRLPPFYAIDLYGVLVEQLATLTTMAEDAARQRLKQLRKQLRGAVDLLPVETGRPAAVILRQARKLKAGLIVMGSHGHGALHDFFIGSTAQGVLRRAACPVMLVPAPRSRRRAARR